MELARRAARIVAALLLATTGVNAPAAFAQQSAVAAQQAVAGATGAALQADAVRALEMLRAVPAEAFVGEDAKFRACMLERFGERTAPSVPPGVGDAFVREALQAYQTYWWRSVNAPSEREKHEAQLLEALRRLLGPTATPASGFDELEPMLAKELRARGYYALQGVTLPLRELMIWTKQQSKEFPVELPEGRHDTRVELLDDFVSFGWSYFTTCGRRATGGWATKEALFAVVPRYKDLLSEEFQVTFLGHETQHLVDQQRLARMEPWELEYRAKLTELALARTTRARLIEKFTESQGDDPSSPHAYANKRVLQAIRVRLGRDAGDASYDLDAVPIDAFQAAARAALLADSQRRPLVRATTQQ